MSSILRGCLIAVLFASTAFAQAREVPILSVKKDRVNLYAHQDEHAEILQQLDKGEELIPFASAVGKETKWHIVKTKQGVFGWVRSADVVGTDHLEAIVRKRVPKVSMSQTTAYYDRTSTVPVHMTGSSILVPVLLNGNLKARMLMDTGATFTTITPRIAKKLGVHLDRYAARVPLMTANGYISAPVARLKSLKVGHAEVRSLVVAIVKFSSEAPIAGLLGLNFLNQFHTSLDSTQQLLSLVPRQ